MYRIAICDDNRLHAEDVELIIKAILCGNAEIYSFCDADSLRRAVHGDEHFDILFMDIKLSDENGITLVGDLFPKGCGTQVVYVTAYADYCTKVYETEHIWFLLKPVKRPELEQALRKAIENLKQERVGRIPVRFGDSVHLLSPCDILYAESEGRRLHITTPADELVTYQTLEQFASGLDKRFLICHKSYLVNMDRVRAMENNHFMMDNDAQIPISRQRFAAARRTFLDYIGEKL